MAKVVVLAYSPLDRDPRVLRHVRELTKRHEVTTIGYGQLPIPVHRAIQIQVSRGTRDRGFEAGLLAAGQYRSYLSRRFSEDLIKEALQGESFDLVVANDVETAPLALELAGRAPVWLDMHEYAFDEVSGTGVKEHLYRRLKTHLVETYAPRVNAWSTVSRGLGDLYQERLGIPKVVVVPNAASHRDLPVVHNDSRLIRLIYHGNCGPARGVELLIAAMNLLPETYELTLLLVGKESRLSELRGLAKGKRVRFVDPVLPEDIPRFINSFDLFTSGLQPASVNDRHALPNKFFENIQARIGQVLTPTSDMLDYLRFYSLGSVTEGFSAVDIAASIRAVSREQILEYKLAADSAAHELSWETFAPVINEISDGLLSQ